MTVHTNQTIAWRYYGEKSPLHGVDINVMQRKVLDQFENLDNQSIQKF